MTKIQQIADFTGQTIHVGMDVHLKTGILPFIMNNSICENFNKNQTRKRS